MTKKDYYGHAELTYGIIQFKTNNTTIQFKTINIRNNTVVKLVAFDSFPNAELNRQALTLNRIRIVTSYVSLTINPVNVT